MAMVVIYDCQDSDGSWKADSVERIKAFAELWLGLENTKWLDKLKKKGDMVVSKCGRYEAAIKDGRQLRQIDWAY